MTDDPNSLSVWEPTEAELLAAQYRASGYSAARTGEVCGVSLRTVQRYDAKPEFRELVMSLRVEMMQSLEPKLARVMAAAAEVLIEAMAGRLAGDDPRVQLARDISRDTSFRLLRARVADQIARGSFASALPESATA